MKKSWLLLVLIIIVFLESSNHVYCILRNGLHHCCVLTLQSWGLIFVVCIQLGRLVYDYIFMIKVD